MIDKDKIERLSEMNLTQDEINALAPEEREALISLTFTKFIMACIKTGAILLLMAIWIKAFFL